MADSKHLTFIHLQIIGFRMLCLPRGRTRGTQAPWPGRMRSTPSELLARPPYRCAGVLACGAVACSHITACFGLFSIQVASAGLGPQLLTVSLPHLRLSLRLLRPSPRSRVEPPGGCHLPGSWGIVGAPGGMHDYPLQSSCSLCRAPSCSLSRCLLLRSVQRSSGCCRPRAAATTP